MNKVKETENKIATAVGGTSAVVPKTGEEKTVEKPKLSSSQDVATKKVRSHKNMSNIIEKHGKTHPKENGKLDDYINFINSPEFQGQKLSALVYTTNHNQSIFSNE